MIRAADVEIARRKIVRDFVAQLQTGKQIQGLPSSAAAVGQSLGSEATQRGLHGSAAALLVLAGSNDPDGRSYVPKLVHYLEHYQDIEQELSEDQVSAKQKFDLDKENVIKISEILRSLVGIGKGLVPTEAFVAKLASSIEEEIKRLGGAGYFLGATRKEVLPTAHAVRALVQHGYDVKTPARYLREVLENQVDDISLTKVDFSVRVFGLYVLAFDAKERDEKFLKKTLVRLCAKLPGLMAEETEQNIEYHHHQLGRSGYVRVPWQLYLLALMARLAPYRLFVARNVQARLSSLCVNITGKGFQYPDFGDRPSTRTYGIAYAALGQVEEDLRRANQPLRTIAWVFERTRNLLGARPTRIVASLAAVSIAVYAVWQWRVSGGVVADLGPEFIASLLVLLMALGKSK